MLEGERERWERLDELFAKYFVVLVNRLRRSSKDKTISMTDFLGPRWIAKTQRKEPAKRHGGG